NLLIFPLPTEENKSSAVPSGIEMVTFLFFTGVSWVHVYYIIYIKQYVLWCQQLASWAVLGKNGVMKIQYLYLITSISSLISAHAIDPVAWDQFKSTHSLILFLNNTSTKT